MGSFGPSAPAGSIVHTGSEKRAESEAALPDIFCLCATPALFFPYSCESSIKDLAGHRARLAVQMMVVDDAVSAEILEQLGAVDRLLAMERQCGARGEEMAGDEQPRLAAVKRAESLVLNLREVLNAGSALRGETVELLENLVLVLNEIPKSSAAESFCEFVKLVVARDEREISELAERIAAALAAVREPEHRQNPYAISAGAPPRAGSVWGSCDDQRQNGENREWSIHDLKTTFGERSSGAQYNFLSEVFSETFRPLFLKREQLQSAEQETFDRLVIEYERKTGQRVVLSNGGSLPLHVVLYYLTAEALRG